jgi:hypothetical protein
MGRNRLCHNQQPSVCEAHFTSFLAQPHTGVLACSSQSPHNFVQGFCSGGISHNLRPFGK